VEDVLQETAKVLWQTFAEYRREEPFLPWACRIAYHRVLSHGRRERTQRKHFRPAIIEQIADARLEHDELLEARSRWLEKCIEKLGETERRLIQQRYASEDTLAELAEQTGRTPNAVYMSMWRIRRALFDCVNEGLQSEGYEVE
jgi:RNA polymerase sigma-70 factor (ECF subfamily)